MAQSTLLGVALVLLVASYHSATVQCAAQKDIVSYIKAFPAKFSKISGLIAKAQLSSQLASASGITIFLPTNQAFTPAVTAFVNTLSATELQDALKYHIVPGMVPSVALRTGTVLKTATFRNPEDNTLIADRDATAGAVLIRGLFSAAKVLKPDVSVGASLVHEVDTVLLTTAPAPPKYSSINDAVAALGLKVFAASIAEFESAENLLPVNSIADQEYADGTVFAISDSAFKKWAATNKCSNTSVLPRDGFTAYSFSFKRLPPARLTHGMVIPTLNFYDEDAGTGAPQELQVQYVGGKPVILAQPWRAERSTFFTANIVRSTYAGRAVLYIIDNVLFPLNGSEDNC